MSQPHERASAARLAEAVAQFEQERRRLESVQEHLTATSTTVLARDRIFSVTVDGRGDLSGITFEGSQYRKLAPAELARLLVDTIAAARRQALQKVGTVLGTDPLPGMSFTDVATGAKPLGEMLDAFLGAALAGLPDKARARAERIIEETR